MFSQASEYALRALTELARSEPGDYVLASQLAKILDVPVHYLAKVLQTLARRGVLNSQRGRQGGFSLALPAAEISAYDIIEKMDDLSSVDTCIMGEATCDDDTACPLHALWKGIRDQFVTAMRESSLADLALFQEQRPGSGRLPFVRPGLPHLKAKPTEKKTTQQGPTDMTIKEIIDGASIPQETRLKTIIGKLNDLQAGESVELIAPHSPGKLIRKLGEQFPHRYFFSPIINGPKEWRLHIFVRQRDGAHTVDEYLSWDHDRLDALMEKARADVESQLWEEAHARVTEFRHGLFRHIDVEENVLFPAFEDATGIRQGGPTSVMRDEHVAIKEAVCGIEKAVAEKSVDDFERWHADLLGVLTEHNMKEENILYPTTDASIEAAARDKLVVDLMLG
ncbi:MAG: Rrf2 family transcriptional regulator [Planctomycetota bacterium]|jgi:Rrf2 family protein